MTARRLYQEDSYLKEFRARVTRVAGNKVFLDQTAFHPRPSGGLDADHGVLIVEESGEKAAVVDTVEEEGDIAHIVDNPSIFREGLKVRGIIDWERRYRMMRIHTATHVVAAILYKKHRALVTGGHITPEMARDDFDLSMVENWKQAFIEAVEEANKTIGKCIEVKIYWLTRSEALKIPGIVKLAEKLPPNTEKLRIVEIPGVDIQADGAPHVKNTCEIGRIKILKMESRGRKRKRLYYTVEP